ncbi:unnamed protein product [Polarella glacialis]|uniref:Fibronectin type-III domain-containing protein n=1 Tax=Polarella glacialis TaxID=89957 RepID=A0A813HTX7_POLGL|nr:unnamed protein product [Polarella glacialis]
MELPETPLSHCKAKVPSLLQGTTAGKVGDLHALKIWLGQKTLQEGGIYVIQLRLGDGHLFSVWSQLSGRFPFAVPRPQLQASDLEVLTLSASVVQCRFPAFRVPSGVTEVSYRLRAEPTAPGSSLQGASPAEEIHLRPAVKTGTVLEANLGNLLPNTEYVFKVSARYPSIGWTTWGEGICSAPQSLCDLEADWVAPPMPLVLPRSGPRPFSLAVEGMPFFHASELAFLLAFPDTRTASDGIVYCLEYRMVGLSAASGEWQRPLELLQLEVTDSNKAQLLASCMAPWKLPPQLWRTRLPPMPQSTDSPDAVAAAHAQQVQFRLSAEMPEDCPSTRWFSSLTPPLCAAMAPPLAASGRLQVADTHLSLEVGFGLDRWLSSISADARAVAAADLQLKGGVQESSGQSLNLPRGFGHAFVSCFQVYLVGKPRCRDAGGDFEQPGRNQSIEHRQYSFKKPTAHRRNLETTAKIATTTTTTMANTITTTTTITTTSTITTTTGHVLLKSNGPSGLALFARASDHACFLGKAGSKVKDAGGTNVRLRWSVLKAHCGLKVIEYALHVHEVLPDGSEICPKRVAALWQGRSAGTEASPDGPEMTTHELRDLRLDVNYIFTLASRYPHVGPREFEDALSSATTSLRPCPLPLAVPMQLPMPAERLRRIQVSRCVLLRWSLAGIPSATPGGLKDFADIQVDGSDPRYDLQALPEGAGEHEWIPCRSISRLKVDGHMAWLVKDIPGRTVRSRFRLWDRDTGRFGRASPLMLSCVDAPSKLAASRVVSESSVQIALKAPAESPSGSDEYVCRFQVRYRPEQVGAPWTELPPQMIWHRQNDHLATPDEPTDGQGAVISGIGVSVARELSETEFIDGEDGGTSWTPNSVQRPPSLPTIPLAEVGTFGEVIRQRCLVTMLREEDGLQADAMYTFSMRVGDLFRLSEWSEPSGALKLAIPAPLVSIALAAAGTCITVTEVTDVSLVASWPQFVPATHAGVPVQAEVEYLLVVVPLPQKRRVVGRARPKEEIPMPLSQWLLSSKLPEGADPETVGMRPQQQLSSTIFGLAPYSNYELRLSVRYSRLGSRHWTEALSYVAVTKKSEGVQAVNALNAGKVSPPLLPGSGGFAGTEVVQAGGRAVLDPKAFLKAKDSPRGLPESPRRLPPLENPSAPPVGRPSSTGDLEEMSPEDAQEWLAGSNADIARITGGAGFRDPSAGPPTVPARQEGEPQEVGYPLVRPPEFVSFWQRDPSRPAMPAMPAASHPAAQLDLFASGSLAPRAPASDRPVLNTGRRPPDHSQVYPRRNMHN